MIKFSIQLDGGGFHKLGAIPPPSWGGLGWGAASASGSFRAPPCRYPHPTRPSAGHPPHKGGGRSSSSPRILNAFAFGLDRELGS